MNPFRTDARVDDLQAKIVTLNKKNTQLSRFYKYTVLFLLVMISGVVGFGLRFWSEDSHPSREEVAEAIFAGALYERRRDKPQQALALNQTVTGAIHAPFSWVNGDSWVFEAREGDKIEFSVVTSNSDLVFRLELRDSEDREVEFNGYYDDDQETYPRSLIYRFERSGQYQFVVFEINDHEFHLPTLYQVSTRLVRRD